MLAHWKTTVQSWLTVIIGLPPALSAFDNLMPPKVAIIISVSAAIAKVVLGQFQQDAGVSLAVLPGQTTPQAVPSHEVPNDPAAVPVAPTTEVSK